jgi:hypothetical protein
MTTTENGPNQLLEAALQYAELGYPVFPCAPGAKTPATTHGCKDATTDEDIIIGWWENNPQYNVGLSTNGLFVLDVDGADNPYLSTVNQDDLLAAPLQRTPRGGRHYVFGQNGQALRNTTSKIAPKVDSRADGGYVLVAPSVVNGKPYQFVVPLDCPPEDLPIVPTWLVNAQADKPKATAAQVSTDATVSEGKRNDWLYRKACALRGNGLTEAEISTALQSLNTRKCNPQLLPDEVNRIAGSAIRHDPNPESDEPRRFEVKVISSAELASTQFDVEYIVQNTLVAGQPCLIAGPQKSLKTSIAADLMIAIARGGYFLGRLPVERAGRVLFMSGESGMATLQETANRICSAANYELADMAGLFWSERLPQFNNVAHLEAVRQAMIDHEVDVLAIDPVYLAMPGADAGNLFIQGGMLREISYVCQEVGATLILVHHLRKNTGDPYEPPELQQSAWAGFSEFARQWLLIGRREKYEPGTGEHRLWLSVGGSAGHSALWGLDISEGVRGGDRGRFWDVNLHGVDEVRDQAQREKERLKAEQLRKRDEEDHRKMLDVLRQCRDGETKNVLRELTGLNTQRAGTALKSLIGAGRAEVCEVIKNRRPETGYKPTGK